MTIHDALKDKNNRLYLRELLKWGLIYQTPDRQFRWIETNQPFEFPALTPPKDSVIIQKYAKRTCRN